MSSELLKPNSDISERLHLERDPYLARLERERRHDRAGDDDLTRGEPPAERGQHIGDVAHDLDPLAGIGLRIGQRANSLP